MTESAKAMQEFKKKLDEFVQNKIEFFDFSVLPEAYFAYEPNEIIPMVCEDGTNNFDPERLQQHMISRLRQQGIVMHTEMWQKMVSLFEDFKTQRQYDHRVGQIGQIGVEILSIYGKMCAVELYEATTGNMFTDNDRPRRDKLMEDELKSLMASLGDDELQFKMMEAERENTIRKFLLLDAVALAICTAFKQVFENSSLKADYVKKLAETVKIYSCDRLTAGLMGITLRDGFMLFLGQFKKSPKDINLASILSVALHEFGHYCARKIKNTYGFSSPVILLSDTKPDDPQLFSALNHQEHPKPHRQDPKLPYKRLEFGRAVELDFFGGISPRWEWASKDAVKKFFQRFDRGDPYPWYKENQAKEEGFEDDDRLPFSFGAKYIPPGPRFL